jgi:hypothetical protein
MTDLEALIEAYLLGLESRETVLREIGPRGLEEIELQRDALRRDLEWGCRAEAGSSPVREHLDGERELF